VNGFARRDELMLKQGIRAGDQLILSKPLGSGILFAADMRGKARGEWIDHALAQMLVSSRDAARCFRQFHASACTDITGFGLLGHLLEMLGEQLSASLQLAQLPLLPGALAQLRAGVRSSMHPANALASAGLVTDVPVDDELLQILFDPQTSGGLLIGVEAGRAESLRDALRGCGYPQAEIIGEVTARNPEAPGVRIA
jgi:selenide,water dikinase